MPALWLSQFDMRVYVVVTSVDPLRVYLFKDGLVRLCTEPYVAPTAKNLSQTRMHLTNYAINKGSSAFVFNDDAVRTYVSNPVSGNASSTSLHMRNVVRSIAFVMSSTVRV